MKPSDPCACVGDEHVTVHQPKKIDIPPKKSQNNPVMKPTLSYALLAALAAVSPALAVDATTTPVGYYSFDGKSGGNLFIPSLVKPAVFAGSLTAAGSTTLTVATGSLTANAFNEGAVYATHYVEITSGPNTGVVLDIVSNTSSVITLADNVSSLSLTGSESIRIRPHTTLKSSLASAEASLSVYSDTATFSASDGSFVTYIYGADGGNGWSSDFVAADGDLRPVPPGTGFVLGLSGDAQLAVSGEVKTNPTVVMLTAGVENYVGPLNPLVGASTLLNGTGFETLAPYSDSITVYVPGPLLEAVTYYPLGDGTVSSDLATSTTDSIANTTGAVVITSADIALKLQPGFTVSP